jgi:hypothetical protein
MLTYADVCSRVLTNAHVCSRMLTYAGVTYEQGEEGEESAVEESDVCSRMLTYAHVCSRMLTYAIGAGRRGRARRGGRQ